mgnify:CR=1 FL=1
MAFSGFSGPRLGLRPTEPQRAALSRARCQAEIYRLKLRTPLGIGFEERTPGEPDGVEVAFLVEGGNAEQDGRICVGDYLLRCSAVILGGVRVGGGGLFQAGPRGEGLLLLPRQLWRCLGLGGAVPEACFSCKFATASAQRRRFGFSGVSLWAMKV